MAAAGLSSLPPAAPAVITPRLALRTFGEDDLDLIAALNGDPEVMRHMGGPMSRAQSGVMLHERILAYGRAHPGLGIWATIERASGRCLGMHVLNHIQGECHVQVGYRLFRDAWGRGYATEMSLALIRYGFLQLGLAEVVAITDPGNAASRRVLEKCRLRFEGLRAFSHPAYAGCGPQAWYRRGANEWLTEKT